MKILSLAQIRQSAIKALLKVYTPEEAQALVRRLLHHCLPEWELTWLQSKGEAPFPLHWLDWWERALARLLVQEPIDYITGKTSFLGMEITLQRGIFIPRPETEEWVRRIVQEYASSPPKFILEVGTGSGAIAIYLAKSFPESIVYGVDKSPLALQGARMNAQAHKLDNVILDYCDFGRMPLPSGWPDRWDLIVSNPPYIPWEFHKETQAQVRMYEPPEALFCEGIGITKEILLYAAQNLTQEGSCVVEIFPPHAQMVLSLIEKANLMGKVYADSYQKFRWIVARRR
ncbi:MAG: HemK/PrmC family methyltransferase [Bacteroidia bacterium]|nr:peptide chain release factor N(5)-glutamine methyltransferase [Bacteroidia bacterium]MDW8134322.1 HemK/PrmC family methyltransferase [Bacteroidia bacterium]